MVRTFVQNQVTEDEHSHNFPYWFLWRGGKDGKVAIQFSSGILDLVQKELDELVLPKREESSQYRTYGGRQYEWAKLLQQKIFSRLSHLLPQQRECFWDKETEPSYILIFYEQNQNYIIPCNFKIK